MKVCGIELTGSDAILVVLQAVDDICSHVKVETKKIPLGNGECNDQVSSFQETIKGFFRDNGIEKVYIKKRNKVGKFAGGGDTFKMEGLIQVIAGPDILLVAPNLIAARQKKNNIAIPHTLYRYQETAYLTGVVGVLKG